MASRALTSKSSGASSGSKVGRRSLTRVVHVDIPSLHLRFAARHEGLNRMLDGFSTRAAWALCTLAYSSGPGTEPILFEGRTDGRIVSPRGLPNLKFGWGPVFEADDTGLTYVRALKLMPRYPWARSLVRGLIRIRYFCRYTEMEATQKNAISHRARALQKLRAYLRERGEGEGDHDCVPL